MKSLLPGVIKLARLEPPLAAVMSIKTKIKQGKHSQGCRNDFLHGGGGGGGGGGANSNFLALHVTA